LLIYSFFPFFINIKCSYRKAAIVQIRLNNASRPKVFIKSWFSDFDGSGTVTEFPPAKAIALAIAGRSPRLPKK